MRSAWMLALLAALAACGSDASERVASPDDVDNAEPASAEAAHRFKSRRDKADADNADADNAGADEAAARAANGRDADAPAPRKRRRLTAAEREMAKRAASAVEAMLPEGCSDGEQECMPP